MLFKSLRHAGRLALPALCALPPAFAQSELQPNPYSLLAALDSVVVTASRFEEPLSAADVVMAVIEKSQIGESGVSNIVEFLDQIPGVSVTRLYGRMGADANVDIGYLGEQGAKNVLVLIDGFRVNNIDDESVRFSQIPLSSIERIEIRGAGAGVLYGDRAMGGVINIITRRDNRNEIQLSAGSFGYRKADAYISRKLGDSHLSVSAMRAVSDGYRDRTKTSQQTARLGLSSETSEQSGWSTHIRFFEEDAELPGGITIAEFKARPRQAKNNLDDGNRKGVQISGEYRTRLTDSLRFQFSGGYDRSDNRANMRSFLPSSQAITTRESKKIFVQPALLWEEANRLVLRSGLDLLLADSDVNDGKQVKQNSLGLYATAEAFLTPMTSVSIGARRQGLQNEFKADENQPQNQDRQYLNAYSIGMLSKLSEIWSVRAGFVSGFRFPTADELYYFDNQTFAPTGIHAGVQAMKSKEFYLVSDVKMAASSYGVSIRHIDTNDEIGFSTTDWSTRTGLDCSPVVIGQGCNANLYDTRRLILSLSGRWQITKTISASLAWDWVDAEILSGGNKGAQIPYVPKASASASITSELGRTTKLIGQAHYRYRMYQADYYNYPNDSGYTISGRTLFDLGLVGRPNKHVQWSLWGRNILNKRYYDYGRDGSNVWGGVYPGDPRSIQVNGTYLF